MLLQLKIWHTLRHTDVTYFVTGVFDSKLRAKTVEYNTRLEGYHISLFNYTRL